MDVIESKSLKLIFPYHYTVEKPFHIRKKTKNMVKKRKKKQTANDEMLPDFTGLSKMEHSFSTWSGTNKAIRLYHLFKVLHFCSAASSPSGPQMLCLWNYYISPSVEKVTVYLEYRRVKWLILLIQTHSILRLPKSSQNYRHSILSEYVKLRCQSQDFHLKSCHHNLELIKVKLWNCTKS